MANIMESLLDSVDIFLAWISTALKQTNESYCDLETADSPHVLVGHDGSLCSILKVRGVTALIGNEEFNYILEGLGNSLQTSLKRPGSSLQVYFDYNRDIVGDEIEEIFRPAKETAERLKLNLDDLFKSVQVI